MALHLPFCPTLVLLRMGAVLQGAAPCRAGRNQGCEEWKCSQERRGNGAHGH
jgi:hypothetical protein